MTLSRTELIDGMPNQRFMHFFSHQFSSSRHYWITTNRSSGNIELLESAAFRKQMLHDYENQIKAYKTLAEHGFSLTDCFHLPESIWLNHILVTAEPSQDLLNLIKAGFTLSHLQQIPEEIQKPLFQSSYYLKTLLSFHSLTPSELIQLPLKERDTLLKRAFLYFSLNETFERSDLIQAPMPILFMLNSAKVFQLYVLGFTPKQCIRMDHHRLEILLQYFIPTSLNPKASPFKMHVLFFAGLTPQDLIELPEKKLHTLLQNNFIFVLATLGLFLVNRIILSRPAQLMLSATKAYFTSPARLLSLGLRSVWPLVVLAPTLMLAIQTARDFFKDWALKTYRHNHPTPAATPVEANPQQEKAYDEGYQSAKSVLHYWSSFGKSECYSLSYYAGMREAELKAEHKRNRVT